MKKCVDEARGYRGGPRNGESRRVGVSGKVSVLKCAVAQYSVMAGGCLDITYHLFNKNVFFLGFSVKERD